MSSPVTAPTPVSAPPSAVPLRWLWTAIGVLGVSVLALGGTLLVQQRGAEPAPQQTAVPRTPEAEILEEKWAPEPARRAAEAPGLIVGQEAPRVPPQPRVGAAPLRAAPPAPAYRPPQVSAQAPGPRMPACAVCGRVESVQAVQQSAPATGVGAVAGGVLGAVVGNQVGKGSGRTAATVLGAVGGGYVGHRVEQNTRTQTVYQVRVRMQDGSVRHFQRTQAVAVGLPIIVEGRSFHADPGAAPMATAGASDGV